MLAIRTGSRMAQDGLEGDDRPQGGRGAERMLGNRCSCRKSLMLVAMTVHDFADREWHVVSRLKIRRSIFFRPLRGRDGFKRIYCLRRSFLFREKSIIDYSNKLLYIDDARARY